MALVTADLGTLLTALYVLTGDHAITSGPRRPSQAAAGCGTVCLAVTQVLLGALVGGQVPASSPATSWSGWREAGVYPNSWRR
jgi:hypothetical protein